MRVLVPRGDSDAGPTLCVSARSVSGGFEGGELRARCCLWYNGDHGGGFFQGDFFPLARRSPDTTKGLATPAAAPSVHVPGSV